MQPTIIGVDLAKSVFQVHGVDAHGKVIVARRLRRDAVLSFFANLPACVVGMEACATAHHWAREISKLGHTVHLMPPQYVKPYVKRHKNDQADAEAVCEAAQHALRANQDRGAAEHAGHPPGPGDPGRPEDAAALRGHLAEFGIVAPQGAHKVAQLTMRLADPGDDQVPAAARSVLQVLVDQLRDAGLPSWMPVWSSRPSKTKRAGAC